MSFRIPISFACKRASFTNVRAIATTGPCLSGAFKPKRKTFNPYAAAISKNRKDASIARQAELRAEREAAKIDPVLGQPTEFLTNIDTIPSPLPSLDAVRTGVTPNIQDLPEPSRRLNHFYTEDEVSEVLETCRKLTEPQPVGDCTFIDDDLIAAFNQRHEHAVEAIRRIIALGNGSSPDRTRENKQLCIDIFGRHNTDNLLPSDPGVPKPSESNKTPRAGPDTGSSEVQAAILTVKIRALSKAMEETKSANKDKHNKRNLRLMVHRRKKLLAYLKKKEKSGVRWRNIMDALGLDDAAIENELFL